MALKNRPSSLLAARMVLDMCMKTSLIPVCHPMQVQGDTPCDITAKARDIMYATSSRTRAGQAAPPHPHCDTTDEDNTLANFLPSP